jgi:predicted nucleic acid-binding protein
MTTLLDTNILVHAYNRTSPHNKAANKIMKKAMNGEIEACIALQVLYEFFAVITNSKRVESPIAAGKAAELCLDLWECSEIEKITAAKLAPKEVFRLVKDMKASGGKVFDCVLAVTAKANKVEAIYTENEKDFKVFSFLKAINPFEPKA